MGQLYRENRQGKITNSDLTALSSHLNKLHTQKVAVKELDISEELLALEQKLTDLEARR